MDRLNGVVLLACVCVLLVVVSGAVESGKVSGFNYGGFSLVPHAEGLGSTNSQPGGQSNYTTTGAQLNSTLVGGSKTKGTLPLQSPYASYVSDFLPALPGWFLAALAVMCFGGACLLFLRLRTTEHVMDLEGTLQEMEQQQRRYLEETWSYRLRNAALLRYYLLMRRACLKVGLRDEPAETPQEYVGRVSSFFKVETDQASRFASAVNRSRYGEELSELEAGEASRFMGAFADVIRRRASESP
ncbi:MAG: DUF4129 domain-containing protein [Nitrososphaerales archaeon]